MSDDGRRLRIGLEAGWDPTWPAGLLYVRNLVYALGAVEEARRPTVRLLPVTAASVERVEDLVVPGHVTVAAPSIRGRGLELRLVARRAVRRWVQPLVGRPLDRAFKDLDVTYPGFGRAIPGTPKMEWIPDFQHVHLPHLFTAEEVAGRERRFADIASSRGIVVLSSEAARSDFERRFPDAVVTPRVWRFATTLTSRERASIDPRARFGLPDTYLYVANQFWAHKDHATVFRALVELRRQGLKPQIVCTGSMSDSRDPEHVPALLRFLDENSLRDQVHLLGYVDRRDQVAIFRHAAAVVQPSTFEGWSTVVEDTKAVGRPLVLSDIPVHREQAPDATFFRTGSVESLANVLMELIPTLRAGPDLDAERIAAVASAHRRAEAGREFVAIAEEAVAIGA